MVAQVKVLSIWEVTQENVKFKPSLSVCHSTRGTKKEWGEERREERRGGTEGRGDRRRGMQEGRERGIVFKYFCGYLEVPCILSGPFGLL